MRTDWDSRYMRLALGEPLAWSYIPGKAGGAACVLVSPDKRELSIGYAGLPRDASDQIVRVCTCSETYRDRYCRHAERNALSNAVRDVTGWTAYVTAQPCVQCAVELHARRIARVVCAPLRPDSRWVHECSEARMFLEDHGVEYEIWVPRQPSGRGSDGGSPPSQPTGGTSTA